jgi:hypothetical protein
MSISSFGQDYALEFGDVKIENVSMSSFGGFRVPQGEHFLGLGEGFDSVLGKHDLVLRPKENSWEKRKKKLIYEQGSGGGDSGDALKPLAEILALRMEGAGGQVFQ